MNTSTVINRGPGMPQTSPARLQHLPHTNGVNACTGNDSTINLDRYPVDQVGCLCLGTIEGNPDDKLPLYQHWYVWPAEHNRILGDLESWSERGLNTYVVPCLFTQRERTYDTALPSAWLWFDDVDIAGADLVESSKGNYQSWIPLDRPITARERQHFQAAIRDQHPGADACSKDAIHFARAIGGWNTKRTPWQVRLVRTALQVVSVDALFARYGQPIDTLATQITNLSWHALPNSMQLAQSARFLRLLAKNEQLERVCTELPVPLMMKNGRLDASHSNARAVFINQLIRAKYPLEEGQSLYIHFEQVLTSGSDFYSDFERLWQHYQPATYRPEPTTSLQAAAMVGAPIGGRHYEINAAELLDYYASIADSRPTGTRADVTLIAAADALGVSVSTIRRRECELIANKQMRRCVTDDRQSSYVLLGAYVCSQPIATPDRADSAPIALVALPGAEPLSDTIEHVCSQIDVPLVNAESVPVEAQCEECAHILEITYTTSTPPAAHMSRPDRAGSAAQRDTTPGTLLDSSSGARLIAGVYVVSPTVDEPQTYQPADKVSSVSSASEQPHNALVMRTAVTGSEGEPESADTDGLLAGSPVGNWPDAYWRSLECTQLAPEPEVYDHPASELAELVDAPIQTSAVAIAPERVDVPRLAITHPPAHVPMVATPRDPDAWYGPDGAIFYPDGAAWLPTPEAAEWCDLLSIELALDAPKPEVTVEQVAMLDVPTPPPAPKPAPVSSAMQEQFAGYIATLAGMSIGHLVGEEQKIERTIRKFAGQAWLNKEYRPKLLLVRAAIAAAESAQAAAYLASPDDLVEVLASEFADQVADDQEPFLPVTSTSPSVASGPGGIDVGYLTVLLRMDTAESLAGFERHCTMWRRDPGEVRALVAAQLDVPAAAFVNRAESSPVGSERSGTTRTRRVVSAPAVRAWQEAWLARQSPQYRARCQYWHARRTNEQAAAARHFHQARAGP